MTPANYDKHFKTLGKLARMYDVGGPDPSTQKLLVSRLLDQAATGEVHSYGATLALGNAARQFDQAIAAGNQSFIATVRDKTHKYLISEFFVDDLTTSPGNRVLSSSTVFHKCHDYAACSFDAGGFPV